MMNMLTELFSSSVAQRIGWALIHFLWQGAAVALVLAVALWLLRHRSAHARWTVSCAALALMAALPVATALTVSVVAPRQLEPAPTASAANMTVAPSLGGLVVLPMDSSPPPRPELARTPQPLQAAPLLTGPDPAVQLEHVAAVSWPKQLQGVIQPALPWAILVWLAGVIVMSVWHFGGWLQVRRMRRLETRPAGAAMQETFDRVLQRLGIRRPVRLLESVRMAVPVVTGWLRPVVLLPVGAITGLTPRQLEAILAHELAHIRRWDCLVQALQAVIETLLFYHPGVWWVSRQIRQESEQCCDDLTVGICGDRRGYAHALAKVAELGARGPAFAAAATGGKLLPRIRRLLGAEVPRSLSLGRCLSGALVLVTIITAGIAVGVSYSPQAGPNADLSDKPVTQPAAGAAEIDRLVKQLGSEKVDERKKAQAALIRIGRPAEARLLAAARDSKLERARRAELALQEIEAARLQVKLTSVEHLLWIPGQGFRARLEARNVGDQPMRLMPLKHRGKLLNTAFRVRMLGEAGAGRDCGSQAVPVGWAAPEPVEVRPGEALTVENQCMPSPDGATAGKLLEVIAEYITPRGKVVSASVPVRYLAKVEFRIAPRPSAMDKAELRSCMGWLKAGRVGFWWKGGRVAGIAGRMPKHAWLPIAGELSNADQLVTGEYKGRKYVLVSDKSGQTMVPGQGKNAWYLAKAYATKGGSGRPAVGFELDARGAELFAALTKANVNNTLAILVDGKVVSAPVIRAALGKKGMITGRFSEQEVKDLVNALDARMASTPDGASTQPAPPPARPKGVRVTGRVLDEPGGKGVKGVTVTLVSLKDKSARSAVTDERGKYVFEGVGYIGMLHGVRLGEHDRGVWTEDARVYVSEAEAKAGDKTATAGDLYANVPCTISGMVIDGDTGKGVAGIRIRVSTADRNRVAFETDEKGAYRLHVIAREVQIDCSGSHDRYLAPDKEPKRKLTVKAGDVVKDVNFTVRSAPRFSGRVLLPDGGAATNVPVLAKIGWSHATTGEAKRITDARARREARIKAGVEAPPAAGKKTGPGFEGTHKSDHGGVGKDFRLATDSAGRFVGYLRRPEFGGSFRDYAIDIVLIARTADKGLGAFKVVQTTTIDPPPDPIEVKLARTATVEFEVYDPDGQPLANVKPSVHSWLFDYINIGYDIPEVALAFANLGGGRYRATGLVPQWQYGLRASAAGYKCRKELKVVAKPGESVDAGRLTLDWWGIKAVPGLIAKLKNPGQYVRQGACHELSSLGPEAREAVEALITALNEDPKNTVRFVAAEALGKIGPAARGAVPDLIRALQRDKHGVPREAAAALGRIGDPAAIDALKAATVHGESDARKAALTALDNPKFMATDPAIPAILKLARSRKGYQGADLVMMALGPNANLRIARMVQEMTSRQEASRTTKHILGILIGRPYENDTVNNVTPRTVLTWWWQFNLADKVPPTAALTPAAMEALWSQLAGEDIVQGRQAAGKLASGGDEAVAFLAEKLRRPVVGPREIAALIPRLGDDKLAARQQAMAQLAMAWRSAEAALKAALKGEPSVEIRSRIKLLLEAVSLPYPAAPSTRQAARGMRVLELIGTPAALKVLADLAKRQGDDHLSTRAREQMARRRKLEAPEPSTQPATGPADQALLRSLGAEQSKALAEYAAVKRAAAGGGHPRKGPRGPAEAEQVAVLRVTAAFALAGGNQKVRQLHGEWTSATRPAVPAGKVPQVPDARIAELIAQLGNDNYEEREDAQRALVRVGWPALPAIDVATRDGHQERAQRARAAMAEITRSWSGPVDGIRCAVRPAKASFLPDEDIVADIIYRNVSDKPIAVCIFPDPHYTWVHLFVRTDDNTMAAIGRHGSGTYRPLKASDFVMLQPGQTTEFRQVITHAERGEAQLKPGQYSLQVEINKINRMDKHLRGLGEFIRKHGLPEPWCSGIESGRAPLTIAAHVSPRGADIQPDVGASKKLAVWLALLTKSPIRSLADYHHTIRTYPDPVAPLYKSVPIPHCELEIRRAKGQMRVARIRNTREFNKSDRRRIGQLPDGQYVVALCTGKQRLSNVAPLVIDSTYDPAKEQPMRLVAIEPGPGLPGHFVGVRGTGPTPEDPKFDTASVHCPDLVVDDVKRGLDSVAGSSFHLKPGRQFESILDLRRYRPVIALDKPLAMKAAFNQYVSNIVRLPARQTLGRAWDEATAKALPAPEPRAVLVGKVFGADGKPAKGYEVRLASGGGGNRFTEKTDDAGAYEFLGVPAAAYRLICNPPGAGRPGLAKNGITIKADMTVQVDLSFQGKFIMAGVVTHADGKPASNIDVELGCKDMQSGVEFEDIATTDEQGRYTLASPFGRVTFVMVDRRRAGGPDPQLLAGQNRVSYTLRMQKGRSVALPTTQPAPSTNSGQAMQPAAPPSSAAVQIAPRPRESKRGV